MDAQIVNQTTKITSLLKYELKRAGAYYIGPCPWCGGVDRFTVKRAPEGDRWHCRKCGDGKYHNVIDFIMRRDGCDFKTALQTLGEGVPVIATQNEKGKIKPVPLPGPQWQGQAFRIVDVAADRLFSIEGRQGLEYLERRGITRATRCAWQIGFAHVHDVISKKIRPAIVIPWITKADLTEIVCIRYRFIDADSEGPRYSCLAGSVPSVFGAWDILESDQTLLLIEGEINALSIWQFRPHNISIISFGSEPEGEIPEARAAILRHVARNYKHIVIWMDGPNRAKQYQTILARSCLKLQSPKREGDKLDANRLLVLGELPAFIETVLCGP